MICTSVHLDKFHPDFMVHTLEETFYKTVISGGVCAIVSAGLNPLDVTKIRLQNQHTLTNLKYHGMIHGMKLIFKEEGIAGLAKGVTAAMWRDLLYSGMRMGTYEPIKYFITMLFNSDMVSHHPNPHQQQQLIDSSKPPPQVYCARSANPAIKFLAGMVSGSLGAALINPMDLIKTRIQATLPEEPIPYRSIAHGLKEIYRTEGGIPGLYKGWIVTSLRAGVITSAQLGSYDTIKNNIFVHYFGMHESWQLHLVSAMSAGIVTTTAANPVDVIKTRYMSDHTNTYRSPLHCVVVSFKETGLRGFMKGWTPAYWRLGPHTVISLMLIERIRKFFNLSTM